MFNHTSSKRLRYQDSKPGATKNSIGAIDDAF
jgi:hypothetical protein